MRADGAWKPAEAVRDPRGPIWPSATSIQGFLPGLGRFEAGFDCACGGKGVALSSAAAGLFLSLTPDEQRVYVQPRRGTTMRQGWSWHATQLERT